MCMQNLFTNTSVMKKISQLPNKQYSQQGEQLSAATFVPSLASRAFCCFFQLWLKETSTPGPGKMRVNYTVEWDCCTVLVLSHPCLRCFGVEQSQQSSSVLSFAYFGSTGNAKLNLFPLNEDNEEQASFWCQHLWKSCQDQVKFTSAEVDLMCIV